MNKKETQQHAKNKVEANIYQMNNTHLNILQKEEVEFWFQLPGNVSMLAFLIITYISLFQEIGWKIIILGTIFINIIVGLINWQYFSMKYAAFLYKTFFHAWAYRILFALIMITSITKEDYKKTIIILIYYIFGYVLIELHIPLYSILSKKFNMHPKYAYFKRYYNYKFPFEN